MTRNALLIAVASAALGCNGKKEPGSEAKSGALRPTKSSCNAADEEGAHFLRVIRQTVAHEGLRTKFHLPHVDSAEVRLATDPSVCEQAGRAFDSLVRTWATKKPSPSESSYGPLYVFQIGNSYGVVELNSANESDCDFIWFFAPGWKYSGVGCSQ